MPDNPRAVIAQPPRSSLLAGMAGIAWAAAAATAQADEVPFVVTPDRVTQAMLELAGVGPGDHVIDLGSGDGRIVITAAKRFGGSGLGVEIVPDLVRQSRDNAARAGVAARTEFREQDLFATDLSRASVVTMYLLPEVNLQLRDRLLALAPGTRIVSHDWDLGAWRPDRTLEIEVPDKPIGPDRRSRVHQWIVPAALQGAWCGAGVRVQVTQRFQLFSASVTLDGRTVPALVFDGRIAGRDVAAEGRHVARGRLESDGRLRFTLVDTVAAALEGQALARC